MFHVLSFKKYSNRALVSSVFLLLSSLFFVSQSYAASISNFGQWKSLSSVIKTAYVAGVIDSFLNPLERVDTRTEFASKFMSCFEKLQITLLEVVQMVDNFYLNQKNWGFTPQQAIRFQLVDGHCFHYLN